MIPIVPLLKKGLIPAIFLSLFVFSTPWSQVLAAMGAEVQEASPTSTEFKTYDGSKYGINMQYPSNWNISEDASGVWFVSPVDETGNVRIESQPSQNLSLSKSVQVQLLLAKNSYKGLDVVSTNMTTLDGTPANRTDYKFKIEFPKFLGTDVVDYSAIQISSIKGKKLYTFTYFSPAENFNIFLPIVEKMLSSIKIQ
jgi:hypothetical protein